MCANGLLQKDQRAEKPKKVSLILCANCVQIFKKKGTQFPESLAYSAPPAGLECSPLINPAGAGLNQVS
jgi:hypothetical protein